MFKSANHRLQIQNGRAGVHPYRGHAERFPTEKRRARRLRIFVLKPLALLR